VEPIATLAAVRADHGAVVVVNPNNPDGRVHAKVDLLALAGRMAAQGGMLHVDEAFADLGEAESLVASASETTGLTVSRSFGKFFGLAGVRLGFVFGLPEILAKAEEGLGPWSVSTPALYLSACLMRGRGDGIAAGIRARHAALMRSLDGAGMKVIGGTGLFALVRQAKAAELFDHLAQRHILVRKFDYAPDWLRIGLTPDEAADERLMEALRSRPT
jgi:cobalamin biosynthetic protein CobC